LKKLIPVFVFWQLVISQGFGQAPDICATPNMPFAEYKALRQSDLHLEFRADTIIYVPLTIHIVGDDEGNGYYEPQNVMNSLCRLNADYEPYKIQFYVKGDWHYINSTRWYDHDTYSKGQEMFSANNVPRTMNCYIVKNPKGACGYAYINSYNMALGKNCLGSGNSTWSHEMGHALSLPHTFNGWEGTTINTSNPTPSTINGHEVEKADSSNCTTAADLFCDTPPDYLSFRWNCSTGMQSSTTYKDPNGKAFKVDGKNFMSYSDDVCASMFSTEQVNAIKNNLLFAKAGMSTFEPPYELNTISIAAVDPILNGSVNPDSFAIQWTRVPNATKYYLRLSKYSDFITFDTILLTQDTSVIIKKLLPSRRYYYTVTALNKFSFCNATTGVIRFNTNTLGTGGDLVNERDINIFPSCIAGQKSISIEFFNIKNTGVLIELFSPLGVKLGQKPIEIYNQEYSISDLNLPFETGINIVRIKIGNQYISKKIIKL
jgi:hypothetical protein